MTRPLLLALAGTRPEVIKLAPLILALQGLEGFRVALGVTGQHQGLLAQALSDCGLEAEFDLAVMEPNQALGPLLGKILSGLEEPLRTLAPAAVIVQGDTTSALAGALAAFYQGIPVAHVEAGLRSGNLAVPFPEEANRRQIASVARWHFAPSPDAAEALVREGVPRERIEVTGNTVIDACLAQAADAQIPPSLALPPGRLVLVTLHRREITQAPDVLAGVLGAIASLARNHPELAFALPAHPSVAAAAERALGELANVRLLPPQPYPVFLALLREACLAISDSGGVQEEGPALGTPVAVIRAETERPEAIEAGGVVLTGLDPTAIEAVAERLLREPARTPSFPYGRGGASAKIAATLARAILADA
ncbi:MAG: UDP-N-acetylglucosamine 2-epimerase (non-hydrolyzing) [Planctomycetes bacterium]|nr:UDP-N-acetylglucosamine 2-epimerase (non-hydrolyzing) [Planctomycetota bacterium]